MDDQLTQVLQNLSELRALVVAQEKNWFIELFPLAIGFGSVFIAYMVGRWSKDTAEKQIDSSKNIAQSQIDASTENQVRELKAQIVSSSRRLWIEDLREQLKTFLAIVNDIHNSRLYGIELKRESVLELYKCRYHIELLMNRREEMHNKLLSEIINVVNNAFQLNDGSDDIKKYVEDTNRVVEVAKNIMKEEWGKVLSLN